MTVLLQSVTVVTKRVGFIPKRDSYHKMQRLLQDASVSTFNIILHSNCVKCVRIWSFSGNSVSLRIQSKCGKIRTRKTPTKDSFHAVSCNHVSLISLPSY